MNRIATENRSCRGRIARVQMFWLWLIVVIALIPSLGCRRAQLKTEYAQGFSEEKLRQIQAGVSVEELLERLGQPLTFRVPALGSRGIFTNVEDVLPVLSSSTNVVLDYSRPEIGDAYQARQIVVRSGRVEKIDAYDYWGD